MNIIGFSGDCEHNSAVALFRDGELVYAEAEERLSRIKGDGSFPHKALQHAVSKLADNKVIFAAPGLPSLDGILQKKTDVNKKAFELRDSAWFELESINAVRRWGGKVERINHHLAHARCAAYLADMAEGMVVTADGQGDGISAAVWTLNGRGLVQRWQAPLCNGSPGFFFAAITEYLGYRRLRDEGKVTALVAAGEPHLKLAELMAQTLSVEEAPDGTLQVKVNPESVAAWEANRPLYTNSFAEKLSSYAAADIALAAQGQLEATIIAIIKKLIPNNFNGELAVGGGLFANVKLNSRLAELPGVKRLFIAPPMGDEGLAIGAAVEVAGLNGQKIKPCASMFLGEHADEGKIDKILNIFPGFSVYEADSGKIAETSAHLLASGELLARCAGPGEFGPRALGNRSLLYRPDDPTCQNWLNLHLGRDSVMPFAPCARQEDLARITLLDPELFGGLDNMTVAVPVTEKFQKSCSGVVHRDGTARIQAVSPQSRPTFGRFYIILIALLAFLPFLIPVLIGMASRFVGHLKMHCLALPLAVLISC